MPKSTATARSPPRTRASLKRKRTEVQPTPPIPDPQSPPRTRGALKRKRTEVQPPSPIPDPQARQPDRRRGRAGKPSRYKVQPPSPIPEPQARQPDRRRGRAGQTSRSKVQSPSPIPEPQALPAEQRRGRAGQTKDTSKDGTAGPSVVAHDVDTQPSQSEATSVPVAQEFSTVGLKLIHAINKAGSTLSIGYSPTQLDKLADHMISYGRPLDLKKDMIEIDVGLTGEESAREAQNAAIIAKLSDIYAQHVHNKAFGRLDKFKLQVTRPECTFNGEIVSRAECEPVDYHCSTKILQPEAAMSRRLHQWYKNAHVSGSGDVREQVTKVDENVSGVREIPATEFSVEPELLERIAALWDQNFYTNGGVRVEPCKIHLYGPGNHFGTHRDTPQKDLIGTFLLGLGDDSSPSDGLIIDGKKMLAHEGHWCAFYPDVPYRVDEIWGGHSALIAFKIFRTSGAGVETETTARVRQEATELMSQMQAPFGIMLEHKYCMGTTELSDFDALLYQSALALPGVDVKQLPVVLTTQTTFESHDEDDSTQDSETSRDADARGRIENSVIPFTRGHIEKLFEASLLCRMPMPSHTECGYPWLEEVGNVPVFSLDLARSLYTYSNEEPEGMCNYTRNEAQAWNSVYVSYALLVLRKVEGAEG